MIVQMKYHFSEPKLNQFPNSARLNEKALMLAGFQSRTST